MGKEKNISREKEKKKVSENRILGGGYGTRNRVGIGK